MDHQHHAQHKESHHASHPHHEGNGGSVWQNPMVIAALIIAVGLIIGGGLFFLANQSGPATTDQNSQNKVVQIVEYSDFQCPFCVRAFPTVQQIKQAYGDKVEFTYKHFPLNSIHPLAQKAAEASECARDQGKFWEYHDLLFSKNSDWVQTDGISKFKQYAADLGLNTSAFNTCLDSGAKKAVVDADLAEGSSKGVNGTPAFFIGGELISGAQPFETFKAKIDAQLGSNTVVTPPVNNDPPVTLTIVNDSTCAECVKTSVQLVAALKGNVLPTVTERTIEVSSSEGQALLSDLGINAIPAFIFGSEVKQTANYAQLQSAMVEENNTIRFADAVASQFGAVKWLVTPQAGNSPSIGDENAKVTIIEFSDFQCPYCKRFYDDTEEALLKKYEGKIRFVYKEFPLESIHPQARGASVAALCANEQDQYWNYHHKLFDNQSVWSGDQNVGAKFKQYAVDLNLNMSQFNDCYDNQKTAGQVDADLQLGASFGVSGTPAFFINGLSLSGAYPLESFSAIIDAELEN